VDSVFLIGRSTLGVPRGPARENHWSKVLRRIQECDPNAYNDIIKTLASQSGRVPEPSFDSKSGKGAVACFCCFKSFSLRGGT